MGAQKALKLFQHSPANKHGANEGKHKLFIERKGHLDLKFKPILQTLCEGFFILFSHAFYPINTQIKPQENPEVHVND